jgi:predicted dehydrogenase
MIAEHHLRAWRRLPEVEIVALGDRVRGAAERRRDEHAPGARVYEDLATMLAEERPDFVDILTPPAAHKHHCLAARAARVHVICQKPLADTLADARELVAAFHGYERLFAVHENHRFRPWFEEVVRRRRAGFFGRVHLMRLEQYDPFEPPEAYKAELRRAVLLEYGTHLVDMMRALLGDPARVFARAHRPNPRVAGESLVHASFLYPEATALIDIGWKPGGAPQGSLLVVGDRGEAYYEGTMTRGEEARFRLSSGREPVSDERRCPTDDYGESFFRFQRACVQAMRRGRPGPPSAEDNLKTLSCTFAAYAAADEERIVELSEWNV